MYGRDGSFNEPRKGNARTTVKNTAARRFHDETNVRYECRRKKRKTKRRFARATKPCASPKQHDSDQTSHGTQVPPRAGRAKLIGCSSRPVTTIFVYDVFIAR